MEIHNPRSRKKSKLSYTMICLLLSIPLVMCDALETPTPTSSSPLHTTDIVETVSTINPAIPTETTTPLDTQIPSMPHEFVIRSNIDDVSILQGQLNLVPDIYVLALDGGIYPYQFSPPTSYLRFVYMNVDGSNYGTIRLDWKYEEDDELFEDRYIVSHPQIRETEGGLDIILKNRVYDSSLGISTTILGRINLDSLQISRVIIQSNGDCSTSMPSPNGRWLVSDCVMNDNQSQQGYVGYLIDLATTTVQPIQTGDVASCPNDGWFYSWSPDDYLFLQCNMNADNDLREILTCSIDPQDNDSFCAYKAFGLIAEWSPNGQRVVMYQRQNNVPLLHVIDRSCLFAPECNKVEIDVCDNTQQYCGAIWDPTGQYIVIAQKNTIEEWTNIVIIDTMDGAEIDTHYIPSLWWAGGWSPNGEWLAMETMSHGLQLYSPEREFARPVPAGDIFLGWLVIP